MLNSNRLNIDISTKRKIAFFSKVQILFIFGETLYPLSLCTTFKWETVQVIEEERLREDAEGRGWVVV